MAAQPDFRSIISQPGFDVNASNYGLRRAAPQSAAAAPEDQIIQGQIDRSNGPDTNDSSFTRGLKRGFADIPSTYYALKGLGEDALGFNNAGSAALQQSNQITQRNAQQYPNAVPSISDIHSIGDAASYAADKFGSFIPQAIPYAAAALATGGAGDVALGAGDVAADAATTAGEALAKNAATNFVGDAAGNVVPRAVGQAALDARTGAAAAAARGQIAKQFAVNTAVGVAQNAPNSAQAVLNAPDSQVAALKALGGDVAVSALQAAPITHIFGPTAKPAVESGLAEVVEQTAKKSMWLRRVLANAGKDAAMFGGVNVASTAVNQVAHAWIMHQPPDLTGPGMGTQYLDALASGAVLGLGFGAIGTPVRGINDSRAALLDKLNSVVAAGRDAMGSDAVQSAKDTVAGGAAAVKETAAPVIDSLQGVGAPAKEAVVGLWRSTRNMFSKLRATGANIKVPKAAADNTFANIDAFTRDVFGPTILDQVRSAEPFPVRLDNNGEMAPQAMWAQRVAAMLPPEIAADPKNAPYVDAYTKALRSGFSNLDNKTKDAAGKFVALLPVDRGGGPAGAAVRMLATADKLAGDGRIGTAYKEAEDEGPETAMSMAYKDAQNGPAVEDEANPEAEVDEPTNALNETTPEEMAAREKQQQEPMSDAAYRKALFARNQHLVPKDSALDAQAINKETGKPYPVKINSKVLTAKVLENADFRDPSDTDARQPLLRAFATGLAKAHMHGETIDPASIKAGLKLTNDAAPLTESEAAAIRAGMTRPGAAAALEERGPVPGAKGNVGEYGNLVGDEAGEQQGGFEPDAASLAHGPRQDAPVVPDGTQMSPSDMAFSAHMKAARKALGLDSGENRRKQLLARTTGELHKRLQNAASPEDFHNTATDFFNEYDAMYRGATGHAFDQFNSRFVDGPGDEGDGDEELAAAHKESARDLAKMKAANPHFSEENHMALESYMAREWSPLSRGEVDTTEHSDIRSAQRAFTAGEVPAPPERPIGESRVDTPPLSAEARAGRDRQLSVELDRHLSRMGATDGPLSTRLRTAFMDEGADSRVRSAALGTAMRLADGNPRVQAEVDLAHAQAQILKARGISPASTLSDERIKFIARSIVKEPKKFSAETVNAARHAIASDPARGEPLAENSMPDRANIDAFPGEGSAPFAPRAGSIRESLRAIREHPAFKALVGAGRTLYKIGVNPAKEQLWVDHLARGFGLDHPVDLHFFDTDELGRNGFYQPVGEDGRISHGILGISSKLKGAKRISVIAHEIGHAVAERHLAAMSLEERGALVNDYAKWLKKYENEPDTSETRAARAPVYSSLHALERFESKNIPKSLSELSDDEHAYLYDLHEYMADNVARAITENGSPIGQLGVFFGKLGHAMGVAHELAKSIDPRTTDAAPSVKQFVESMWAPERDIDEMSAGGIGDKQPEHTAVPPHPAGTDMGGTPGKLPHNFLLQLNRGSKKALYDFLSRAEIVRQIIKYAPEAQNKALYYGSQMETLINLGVAAHLEGKLDLSRSESVTTSFHNVVDAARRAIGFPTDSLYAKMILRDFKNANGELGSVDKPYNVHQQYINTEAKDWQKPILGVQNAIRTFHRNVSQPLLGSAHNRLQNSGIPALQMLSGLFHLTSGEIPDGDQVPYSLAVGQATGQWLHRAQEFLHGMKPEEEQEMTRALENNDNIRPGFEPHLQQRLIGLRSEYAHFHKYMSDAGVKMGKAANPYGVVINPGDVKARAPEFEELLAQPHFQKPMRDMLEKFNNRAMARGEPPSFNLDKMSDKEVQHVFFRMAAHHRDISGPMGAMAETGLRPGFRDASPRVSQFIFDHGTQADIDKFNSFRSKDLKNNVFSYFQRGVKRAEFDRLLTKQNADGTSTNKVDSLMALAKEQGATEGDLKHAQNFVDAQLGTATHEVNPVLKKLLQGVDYAFDSHLADITGEQVSHFASVVGAYQNVRLLWLNVLGSLADPIGNWARTGGDIGLAWKGYSDAVRTLSGKDGGVLKNMAEALGITERHALTEALLHSRGTGDNASDWANKVNAFTFKWNGMSWFTKVNRIAALATGNRFLQYHAAIWDARSQRYFRELGLNREDVHADPKQPGYVELTPKIQHALYRFVNESNINPNVGESPLWFKDPHFALLAQYKNYMYSFYHNIVERMAHEVAWGNVRGAMPAVGYLGMTAAGEFLRGAVQYGPSGNPNVAGQSPFDYMKHIVDKSALAGPGGSIGLNIGSSFMSPTRSQGTELLKLIEGKASGARTALDALPGSNVYGHWFAHAGM